MAKQIIRLTESDLHNIIKETVRNILKENIEGENYLFDILNGTFDDVVDVEKNDDFYQCHFIVEGESGEFYNIYANAIYFLTHGMGSNDYDMPNDPDEFDVQLDSIDIKKVDGETSEEIDMFYDGSNEELNNIITQKVYDEIQQMDLEYTDDNDDFYYED